MLDETIVYTVNDMTFEMSSLLDIENAISKVRKAIVFVLNHTNLYGQDRDDLMALSQAEEDLIKLYNDHDDCDEDDCDEDDEDDDLASTIHTKAIVVVNGRTFNRTLPRGDEVVYVEDRPWPQRYEVVFGSRFRGLSERGQSEPYVGVKSSNLDGQLTNCPIQLANNDIVTWIKGPFADIESAISACIAVR